MSGLELSGACLLLMASLFSCCYMSCREIDYSKTSYGILIAVVIMLGGMCVGIRLQLNQKQYILNLFITASFPNTCFDRNILFIFIPVKFNNVVLLHKGKKYNRYNLDVGMNLIWKIEKKKNRGRVSKKNRGRVSTPVANS